MKSLEQLYQEHDGKVSDKWSLYLIEYDRLFRPYRDQPIRLLEIGVQNGGSLEMWSKYFHRATKVIGCDISQECSQLRYNDPRVGLVIGNATAKRTLCEISTYSDQFDIIIDDGSHRARDIICSFIRYFPLLSQNGLYVVEDLHCSYWKEYSGGLYHPCSSISFFKLLVDIINREHWGIDKSRSEMLSNFEEFYRVNFSESLLRGIHSLEFINSLCIIRKRDDRINMLGRRVVAGTSEAIYSILEENGQFLKEFDQRTNDWTTRQEHSEDATSKAALLRCTLLEREASLEETRRNLATVMAQADALRAQIIDREHTTSLQRSQLEAALAKASQQLHSTAAELEAAETARSLLESSVDEMRRDIASVTAQLSNTAAALARERIDAGQQRNALEGQLASAKEELAAELAALAKEKTGSALQRSDLENKIVELEQLLQAITTSTTWRSTAPARAILSRMSPRSKRLARRVVKAAYRAVTPYQMLVRRKLLRGRAIRSSDQTLVATGTGVMSTPAADRQHNGNLERRPQEAAKTPSTWTDFFDGDWYLARYSDVGSASLDPIEHFLQHGAAEGRDPNPAFNTVWYLSQYRDVADAGLIAIDHYVEWGAAEGRRPFSGFNYDYYREQAGIRQASNLDAYRHYLRIGRRAGLIADAPQTVMQLLRKRFSAIEPLRVFEAPHHGRRVTMVTDSINAGSLYGGVATAIILGVLMARRLNGDLRLVTRTEPADACNIAMILRTHGVHWAGNVEIIYSPPGQGGQDIPVSRDDFFLTTSWWGTRATRSSLPASRIFYMIGEDERLFYPTGDDYLLCGETLSDPDIFYAVNSRVLFEHLQANGLAPGGVAFEPAFSSTAYYPADRALYGRRQFFFYGRPNNLRNLYWRGVSAIAAAIEEDIFQPEQWDFTFLGKDMDEVGMPRGVRPRIMNDATREDYLDLVRRTDVGLSLIYTPHPSYPPFDLAACGAVVVTNRFSCKTDLSLYSPNILCVEPSLRGLVGGLRSAVELANDRAKCVANIGRFAMPRDWETALGPILNLIADRYLGG